MCVCVCVCVCVCNCTVLTQILLCNYNWKIIGSFLTAACFGSSYRAIFRLSPKKCYTQLAMLFRAQPEDGCIRGTETRCCYNWFKYLLIVITQYKVVLDCSLISILLIIEHNEDVSPENYMLLSMFLWDLTSFLIFLQ